MGLSGGISMCAVLGCLLLIPSLAHGTPQVGLEIGVGQLDERLRLHLRPDLILRSEANHLHLSAPIELFPRDLQLRSQDWDSLADFSAILQSLKWRQGGLSLQGGKLHFDAATETVVQRYPIGHHPNRPGSAVSIQGQGRRWRGQLGAASHFVVASLGYSLWQPQKHQPVQPELAVVVAGTHDSPIVGGHDGRVAWDLTLPYHGKGYALAGYASAVAGLGSHQNGTWRVHGGLRGEHRLEPDWLRWRLELRHSPSGLVAQPFDSIFGMLDPLSLVSMTAEPGLGVAARFEWSDRLRLRFDHDPGLQRAEGVISIHRGKTGRFYLGAGWLGVMKNPFLLSECRWRLQKGATLFARVRFLERSIDGGMNKEVLDGMVGISWALALQPGN